MQVAFPQVLGGTTYPMNGKHDLSQNDTGIESTEQHKVQDGNIRSKEV